MPVADAFLYDARDRRLVPVPGSIAGVHGMQGLSMEDRRRLWLFMRQVERAATGAPTSLFEGRHFLADLQHCHLPDFVQVRRARVLAMSFTWLQRCLPHVTSLRVSSRHFDETSMPRRTLLCTLLLAAKSL